MKAVWNERDSDSDEETEPCERLPQWPQRAPRQGYTHGDVNSEKIYAISQNNCNASVSKVMQGAQERASKSSRATKFVHGDIGRHDQQSEGYLKMSKPTSVKSTSKEQHIPNRSAFRNQERGLLSTPSSAFHLGNEKFTTNEFTQQYETQREAILANASVTHDSKDNLASFQRTPNQTRQKKGKSSKATAVHKDISEEKDSVKIRKITYHGLKNLLDKDPNEVLLTLLQPEKGFLLLLSDDIFNKRDLIPVILLALAKACKSSHKQNVSCLINAVTQNQKFMFCSIQLYVASFQIGSTGIFHMPALESLLQFLSCYNQLLPSSACETLSVIIPVLNTTFQKIRLSHPDFFESCTKTIAKLELQKNNFIQTHSPESIVSTSKMEKVQLTQPPENFRTIPILPNDDDIWNSRPFLRPNITNGKYSDMEHYLDVQFRLLREDYIRPLRDGIATYLRLKSDKKSLKKCKEVKIYTDVHIVKQEFTKGSLIHLAAFNIKEFSKVNWECSKRFLSGSLVCLSHNDFQTSHFASVAFRDIGKLKEGILILKFEDLTDEVLGFTPEETFVLVETDAYFEAFRHNLSALQNIETDEFPLRNYIIDVHKEISSPAYLRPSTTYDMGPMFQPLENCNTTANVVSVQILKDQQWPSAEDLHLDESQHKALKAAITKEFVVIQGPPGTGKTYIGLRIVQLLLHNISCWRPSEETSPILIVCYTNHALDQFLEGVLSFTKDIVRVGGRSSSEILSCYQLDNRRKQLQEQRNVPHYIFSNIKHKGFNLHEFGKELNEFQHKLFLSEKNLLTEGDLVDEISSVHHNSLCSNISFGGKSHIHDWLDIGTLGPDKIENNPLLPLDSNMAQYYAMQNPYKLANHANSKQLVDPNEFVHNRDGNVIEDEDLADVEYIEDMRGIDGDEFADVSVGPVWRQDYEEEDVISSKDKWEVQGGSKKLKEFIAKKIKQTIPMAEEDAEQIVNVWVLPYEERWCLYKYWLELFLKAGQRKILALQQKIRTEYEELNEMKSEENLNILHGAKVVGMTTTGAAKYRKMVQHLNPRIIIVEEAAEILEAHIVTSLATNTQHLIMIGDHQQLRPSPNVYELSVRYNLDVSLFERMVKNGMKFQQLSIQHRMRPSIASLLVPHIYDNLQNHESVHKYEQIKGVSKSLFFITHDFVEDQEFDSKSRVNMHEAKFIAALCRYFLLQGYSSSQITVLTTYSGQQFVLKRLIKNTQLLKDVRITVVDNFQGEENDIILLSFVRSNEEGVIGFLKIANRVCVALSRAKKGLFAIGNFSLLVEKSDLWKNLVSTLEQQEAIGRGLSLKCQNHPKIITLVSKDSDFDNVPEGGCRLPCEYRLNCGHTCPIMCHSYDPAHENVFCQKPCKKILCQNNHPCPKLCSEECGPCKVKVEKEIPGCKHKVLVPCHIPPDEFPCPEKCVRKLLCGHSCKTTCGKKCTNPCIELINTELQCGHELKIQCYDVKNKANYLKSCTAKCYIELQCGHICSGNCGRCHQGRLHQICKQPCKRILVCGHECQTKCSTNCPPCKRECENRCVHNKCSKRCGNPCVPCKELCAWSCEHQICTKPCGELCDREPCDEPCTKRLKCGHTCIGLCGEPCPRLCATCNPVIKEIFFGSEDADDARYIELEDCKHIFEVEGLTHWMRMAETREGEIQMKACPRCKTVIRKNLRFGNTIKTCLAHIEKVKSVVFGEVDANRRKISVLTTNLQQLEHFDKFKNLLEPLLRKLKKKGMDMGNSEIIRSENIITLMKEYLTFYQFYDELLLFGIPPTCAHVKTFSSATCDIIDIFIGNEYLTASDQQLEELSWEIQRLKLIQKYLEFRRARSNSLSEEKERLCKKIERDLCNLGPFRLTDKEQFYHVFKKVNDSAIINISDTEKKSILKAMNLSQGHWYMCPNGHVYCITECGGAMVESKCNECDATIGGGHHALRSDNRLARDMDGATLSAWPQTYDLRNYGEFN